ncbi:hypothetical protein NBE98_08100 [Clostridium swellfunianum]|uniref:hypothetical protein n=1 Tax=Clostridium swellfunianum TaxID=1367462 RepID=UPI0020307D7B|nr:hypothetical protein [Clostridium swellfunianum]MCM0648335.1 hypothetical protein [Clostridium swellfunianum]
MDIEPNEFLQILDALENMVFKIRKDEFGKKRIMLSEGKLAKKLGITTKEIYGKTVIDIYPIETARYMDVHQEMAFGGQNVEFELMLESNKNL